MSLLIQLPDIDAAIATLKAGGIVMHATETCYGIACDLTNPDAVKKLFAIKKRPEQQPVSALFSSIESAKLYVDFSDRALELAQKYLPGPLTLVLPTNTKPPSQIFVCPPPPSPIPSNLSPLTYHLSPTIGVRISSHPLASRLAELFGKPIATTSANLHGEPNPYSIADLQEQFSQSDPAPDLILNSGTLPTAPPSTVVEVRDDTVRVLRQGELKISKSSL